MKVNLDGMVRNNLGSVRGTQAEWAMKFMCDALRIVLTAPPDKLPEVAKDMRELLCVAENPPQDYETLKQG